ncbi:MAG: hypothetical protein ACR2PT_09530 [Endozoicomonas sp.]
MNGRPLVICLAFLLTPWVSADTVEQLADEHTDAETGQTASTFGLRTYSAEPDYSVDWSGKEPSVASTENKRVLVVDYYPFDSSGFRVSAGAYSGERSSSSSHYSLNDGIAYFGVGWKAMLGEAKRLDLSVEVGTFFGSSYEATSKGEETGSDSTQTFKKISELDESGSNRPVISFGMNYRF